MATAAMFFPGCTSTAKPRRISANEKINVAFVGVGNIGSMALNGMREENGVALCDVDTRMVGKGKKMFPKAKVFQDYREMLDKLGKEIDAVCVSTPDTPTSKSRSIRAVRQTRLRAEAFDPQHLAVPSA